MFARDGSRRFPYVPITSFVITLLIMFVTALLFYPISAPGQQSGGGGGGETAATNLSYPASFYGKSPLTSTIGAYSLGGTLGKGMSYGCLLPEKIGTTTYANTSCVTDNGDGTFTADNLGTCQQKCPNATVERIYWQKNASNTWVAGYGTPLSADDGTTPLALGGAYIDWADNLETKSWPVQKIRVEFNAFADNSALTPPAEGTPNTWLRFDVWHVFGSGTNELWGAHATDTDPATPYTYAAWPYAIDVAGDGRLNITKLGKESATCPTTATGTTQSPYEGSKRIKWQVDSTTGNGQWSGAAYTSALVNKVTPELNIKGNYVYGYNWDLKSEPVPDGVYNTGWWRLTFYSADKSVDFVP